MKAAVDLDWPLGTSLGVLAVRDSDGVVDGTASPTMANPDDPVEGAAVSGSMGRASSGVVCSSAVVRSGSRAVGGDLAYAVGSDPQPCGEMDAYCWGWDIAWVRA